MKATTLRMRADKSWKTRIERAARRRGLTASDVVRWAVLEWLDRNEPETKAKK